MSTLGMMRVPAGDGGAEKAAVPPTVSKDEVEGKPRTYEGAFEKRMKELKEYKEKHGHLKVKASEDKSLYNFCNSIRCSRRGKGGHKLTKERIDSLDAIEFDWEPHLQQQSKRDSSFQERLEALRAYKAKNEHLKVKASEDKSLYNFCTSIRQARRGTGAMKVIKKERIASLDAIGFDWGLQQQSKKNKSFEERVEAMAAYKVNHEHINVKASEDKSLAQLRENETPAHHIEQTLLGPVCSKCKTKVAGTGGLFCVTHQTLRLHWKRKKCHTSNRPNARAVERQLNSQLVEIHERIAAAAYNGVKAMVSRELPPGTKKRTTSFCSGCGFIGKQCKVKTHVSSDLNGCKERHIARGTIYETPTGFRVPKQFLQRIVDGTFRIPSAAGAEGEIFATEVEFAREEETYEPVAVNQLSTPSEQPQREPSFLDRVGSDEGCKSDGMRSSGEKLQRLNLERKLGDAAGGDASPGTWQQSSKSPPEETAMELLARNRVLDRSRILELEELVKTLKARNIELVKENNELREENNCALKREGTDSLKRKRGN